MEKSPGKRVYHLTDLDQDIPWRQTLTVLGVPCDPVDRLPTNSVCPVCDGRMVVYPNTTFGEWAFCFACRWSGTPLMLARMLWGLPTDAVIIKLRKLGVPVPLDAGRPERISAWEFGVHDYRQKLNAFWKQSAEFVFQDNPTLVRIHETLDLPSARSPKRWNEQMGRLIGASHKSVIRSPALHLANMQGKTFTWARWDSVLVIPACDVPGHLTGLWFGGGRNQVEWFFRRIPEALTMGRPMKGRETGLGFLEACLPKSSEYGDTAFVTLDPETAVRIQGAHFRDNTTALPLALAHVGSEGAPAHVWRCTPEKSWVVLAARVTPDIIRLARSSGAKIAMTPHPRPPYDTWLKTAARNAVHWPRVLAESPDHVIEACLLQLGMDDNRRWAELRALLTDEEATRVELFRDRKFASRFVKYYRSRIVETAEGWFHDNAGGIPIANFTTRVCYAVRPPDKDKQKISYQGYFLHQGKKYHWSSLRYAVRDKLADMAEEALILAGAGVPRIDPVWRKELFDIAMAFSSPKILDHCA